MNKTEVIEEDKTFSMETLTSRNIHNSIVRLLISLFIFTLGLWLLSGIMHLAVKIFHGWNEPWEKLAEGIIVNSLSMLALLEIIRTLQCYLEIGRVRVTFILDATLVALIGELIGLWYREYTLIDVTTSVGVITALVVLRIVTTCYSPYMQKRDEDAELL